MKVVGVSLLFAILLQCAEAKNNDLAARFLPDLPSVNTCKDNLDLDTCKAQTHDCSTSEFLQDFCQKSCGYCVKYCSGVEKSGTYTFEVDGVNKRVVCEVDGDGNKWTVFQRRGNYGSGKLFFYKDWNAYRNGFGDTDKDFWLGLEAVHQMVGCQTCHRPYELQIDMEDWQGKTASVVMKNFKISDENDRYRLTFSTAHPSNLAKTMDFHNGKQFFTKDKDSGQCARQEQAAWWYGYGTCWRANLNGRYRTDQGNNWNEYGVAYSTFGGFGYSLKSTVMKFRPG